MYTYVVNWLYNSLSYSSSHKAILSLCMARTLKSSNLINVTVQRVIVNHSVDSWMYESSLQMRAWEGYIAQCMLNYEKNLCGTGTQKICVVL